MIVKHGGKFVVKSHDGSKTLGSYDTEGEAKERLREIEAAKAAKHDSLTGVHRFDVGELEKPQVTPAGFLRVDGYLTRAGIFAYRNADGTTRRELRPPDEVFHSDSVQSFALAPVTDDHPPANLTADNARDYQRGAVTENLRQDGDYLRGRMLITDASLREKMMGGRKSQVSCGYTCDVDLTPGEWNGQRYDAVQKNIRGNHVAIVEYGRAGAGARVRMDAQDAAMLSLQEVEAPERTPHMKTFRFDGVTFEASEQVCELFAKLEKERNDAVSKAANAGTEAQKLVDAATAKLDAAKSELEKAKLDAAKAPDKIRAELKARMHLDARAAKVLGKDAKLDGKTAREVQVLVLKKLEPKLDVTEKSDEYVTARFDVACESSRDTTDELRQVRENVEARADEERDDEEKRSDVEGARQRMNKAAREMYKEPIGRVVQKAS